MKKQILIITAILLIFTIGVFFWIQNRVNNYKEDTHKSNELAPSILAYFNNGKSLESYPFEAYSPNWGTDYLALVDKGVRYNNDWNEQLQTQHNFPGDHVKGLVIIDVNYVDNGEYVDKNGRKVANAQQRNYILSYFDIAKETIIARDTVFGEEPAQTIRKTGSGIGDLPSKEQVIDIIKNKIK